MCNNFSTEIQQHEAKLVFLKMAAAKCQRQRQTIHRGNILDFELLKMLTYFKIRKKKEIIIIRAAICTLLNATSRFDNNPKPEVFSTHYDQSTYLCVSGIYLISLCAYRVRDS